ncbi:cobalamin-dependent protein [Anaerovorax odorimutans]|uniref:Cobalamin-dependent protein n=2 Tax=Anaerovorax odorimutans TaxID=109327 RepID=A0ABT1RLC9_9FIRM|nr:cobalamin-dependent protein [Anaerovorax odorimutans]
MPQLDEPAKRNIRQAIACNLGDICAALELEDNKLFTYSTGWFYRLLCPRMPSRTTEAIKDLILKGYDMFGAYAGKRIGPGKQKQLQERMRSAVAAAGREHENSSCASNDTEDSYGKEIQELLDCLLSSQIRDAIFLVSEYRKRGIPLEDIYVDITAGSMRRVGDMWHQYAISEAQEHYCTATAQLALAQFYPVIFRQERKRRKVLVACVGSELHEMGARMVADLFEYDGWDSIYLGAEVPIDSILSEAKRSGPDLLALSVTLPQHLLDCREAVRQARRRFPDMRLAVGGNAFSHTDDIWEEWEVDVYTKDARDLVKWADKAMG